MKITLNTDDEPVTSAGSVFFALFGCTLGALIFFGPMYATNDIPESSATVMRWTGVAIWVAALWTATSKHLSLDANSGRAVWRRRFALMPFIPGLNGKTETTIADIAEVKLLKTHSNGNTLGMVHLKLYSGKELRLTHMALSYKYAKNLQKQVQAWLNRYYAR